MSVSFLNPTAKATVATLASIFDNAVEPGKAVLKNSETPLGDVTALVDLTSNFFHISVAISFNEQSILALTQRIINETHFYINDTVKHIAGDVAVMVGGGIKRTFSELGHDVTLKHPRIHLGYNTRIIHPVKGPKIVFPINTEDGIVFLETCIDTIESEYTVDQRSNVAA